jgi:hypothetical protein
MATTELEDDEVLDDEIDIPEEGVEVDEDQEPDTEGADGESSEAADAPEMEVVVEGDEPKRHEKAPKFLVEMRKQIKEQGKELRAMKRENEVLKKGAQAGLPALGPKPTLESCGWDASKLDSELQAWYERDAQIKDISRKEDQKKQEETRAWQKTQETYLNQKAQFVVATKVRNYADAEAEYQDIFTPEQQGVILHASEKRPEVIYYLGTHPEKAQELAAMNDHIKLVREITKLEGKLHMKPKATDKPGPEARIPAGGGASVATGGWKKRLADLEAEAQRTGSRKKFREYVKALREKGINVEYPD